MSLSPLLVGAGLLVGLLYGLFGVGSAFATPLLALIGVPGMAAVVGPLPGLLPGSATGAWTYSRSGKVDWRVARAAAIGAVPAAILGALASRVVGGPVLLVASGVTLLTVGVRVLRPARRVDAAAAEAHQAACARRRANTLFVAFAAAGIGFLSGLLANGGGFLLVPLFLLALGLDMHKAAGTSLVVASTLTLPTLLTHAVIGDIDWTVAGFFALGLIPGVLAGSHLAPHLPTARLQRAFGALLVGFAVWFLVRQGLTIAG